MIFQRLTARLAVLLMSSCVLQMAAQTSPSKPPAEDFSGMYAFLREGEFLQLNIEEGFRVTGFISRYGDSESDRGAFLDQFFKDGKLEGTKLSFTTETVHAVWYEFTGSIERGEGKTPADEAYYVLKGTLRENRTDADKKVSSTSRDVALKSFPKDIDSAPPKSD